MFYQPCLAMPRRVEKDEMLPLSARKTGRWRKFAALTPPAARRLPLPIGS